MAPIKCPECGKEISSLAESCPYCGCPIKSQDSVAVSTEQYNDEVTLAVPTNHSQSKIRLKTLIVLLAIIIVLILAIVFGVIIPNQKEATYSQALSLLDQGNYVDAQELLKKIDGYKDANQVLNESKYESLVLSAYEAIRYNLKNPNSMIIYEVFFYSTRPTGERFDSSIITDLAETFNDSLVDEDHPIIVMRYGAENGYGGISTGYYVSTFDSDDEKYGIYGTTDSDDFDGLNKNDKNYAQKVVTTAAIIMMEEESVKEGEINIDRVNKTIRNLYM